MNIYPQNNSLPLKHDKVFNHENIAEATKITQFDDGILVEWGYIEGKECERFCWRGRVFILINA
ncbi:MAG: hypothetical protein IPG53_17770 [Ignavibacteriales bacterium]|nr:hypothetical protein [Ignavibacteriales bacterium]